MSTAHRLAAILLTGSLAACSGASESAERTTTQSTHDVTATAAQTRSGGSRAYMVATMAELSARADAVVVATKSGSPREEPADEAGASGLTMTTTPVEITTWIKGKGPTSVPLSELNLRDNEDEVAQVRSGHEYVLFLEKVDYAGEPRYILVGGVGAYEIGDDERLTRVDGAGDTFPRSYASLDDLTRDVASAPESWTATP